MFCRRIFFSAVIAVAFSVLLHGRALAYVEYCGASAAVVPVAAATNAPADTYALLLTAGTPRTVSGSVTMKTTDGWYSVPFTDVALAKQEMRYRTPTASFTRTEAQSEYLYLRFPSPVSVENAFVANSIVTNEHEMGWSAAPRVCPAYDVAERQSSGLKRNDIVWLNPHPSPSPPSPGISVMVPQKIDPPGDRNCTEPAKEASVSKAVSPRWPVGYRITTPFTSLVEVAVGKDGSLDDAWIYVPSGVQAFDDAAVSAARASTYQPGRAFCQSVPGVYLFRAMFKPR